ncbi:MAG: Gmad2 immunoglobulin-like domain-containing protein [Chloroflexi bacterium]|nr:Gmad2 immunoglobulin-like domain-containing protein [Chloroflexota bacterium]MQC16613.1 hypothetical protein [Chloroflexota bacterium]
MFRRTLLLTGAALVLLLGAACTDDPVPADTSTPTSTSTESTGAEPGTPPGTSGATTEPTVDTGTPSSGDTPTQSPTQSDGSGGGTSGSGGIADGDACATLAPEAYDAAFTFVTSVAAGDYLASGTTVAGCSRTFESNVPWRLLDRDGNVIAESFAMGGGVDGPAPFEFTVEYSVASAQVGHLFVGGDDPSDGEGFPPVTNQIPVVLLP